MAALAAVFAGSMLGLTSCTNAAPIGVMRDGNQAVILLGYQCVDPTGFLHELSVGRTTAKTVGPAIWSIKAQHASAQHQVRVGVVPDGYQVTVDSLHGEDLGDTFWVEATFAGNHYSGVDFDLSKIKNDGDVMDSSRRVISRSEFDKRYGCSS